MYFDKFTRYIYIVLITEYNIVKGDEKMKIVSEVNSQQELDELKVVMEIFIVNNRIKEIAQSA